MKSESPGRAPFPSLASTLAAAIASAATIGACSSDGTAQPSNGMSAGTTDNVGAAGSAGATSNRGSGGASGMMAAVTAGSAGTPGGPDAGSSVGDNDSGADSGTSDATSTSGGELAKGPFTCSTYIGAALTTEWWNQGFENIVDNAKWQLKWHHHGFIEAWGDPLSPFWGDTGDPNDPNGGSPIVSPCAQNSKTPDRVVFLAIDWVLLTEQDWIDWLEKDLIAIRMKYPSVKWIDIMPTVRCPDNRMCNPNAMPGPGANDGASAEDCYIPPFEDSAIAKVVAAHADSVGLGPILMATMCNGGYGAHLTVADNKLVATAMGNYYKALP
jgi:hypothetical protein